MSFLKWWQRGRHRTPSKHSTAPEDVAQAQVKSWRLRNQQLQWTDQLISEKMRQPSRVGEAFKCVLTGGIILNPGGSIRLEEVWRLALVDKPDIFAEDYITHCPRIPEYAAFDKPLLEALTATGLRYHTPEQLAAVRGMVTMMLMRDDPTERAIVVSWQKILEGAE